MENQQTPKKSGRGGPRANSGGKRPGAGRKKNPPELVEVTLTPATSAPTTQAAVETAVKALNDAPPDDIHLAPHEDPLKFLIAVMLHNEVDVKLRVEAAKSVLPFTHKKLGEGGKKEQKDEAARRTASKFAPAAPPKLKAV